MHDHHRLAQALGAGGAHEVGAQHLQHGSAREPRDRADQHRAERRCRQDQARQSACPDRAGAPGERQQRPLEADILDQQQADEEHRHRHAGHRERHDDAVGNAAAIDRGQRAERQPAGHRDQHAAQHQLDRRADGEGELLAHHLVGDDRASEIATQHPQDVFEELDRDRSIEAELEPDRRDRIGLGVGAGDDHRRIGRHDLQQAEAQEQHPEQGGEGDQKAMDDLSCHTLSADERWPRGGARADRARVPALLPSPPRFVRRAQHFVVCESGTRRMTRHAQPWTALRNVRAVALCVATASLRPRPHLAIGRLDRAGEPSHIAER